MARWRWWQWVLLGLFLGGLAGFVRVQLGPDFDANIDVTLNPMVFEQYVFDGHVRGKEVVAMRDLVVHPPFGEVETDWVTGVAVLQYNRRENPADGDSPMKRWEETQPFRFSITVPYAAQRRRDGTVAPLRMGDLSQYPDNQAYLASLSGKFPDRNLTYRYAWWEAPNMRIGLWTIGGLVLFGVLIPTLVRLFVPAEERERSGVDLRKVKSTPPKPDTPQGPSAEDQAQLGALEAHLEKSLEGAFPEAPAGGQAAPEAPQPIRQLDAGPAEAPRQVAAPETPREYRGEFYPTIAHAPKEDEDKKA